MGFRATSAAIDGASGGFKQIGLIRSRGSSTPAAAFRNRASSETRRPRTDRAPVAKGFMTPTGRCRRASSAAKAPLTRVLPTPVSVPVTRKEGIILRSRTARPAPRRRYSGASLLSDSGDSAPSSELGDDRAEAPSPPIGISLYQSFGNRRVFLQSGKPAQAMNPPRRPYRIRKGLPHFSQASFQSLGISSRRFPRGSDLVPRQSGYVEQARKRPRRPDLIAIGAWQRSHRSPFASSDGCDFVLRHSG